MKKTCLIFVIGLAAVAQTKSGPKMVTDSKCQIAVPGDWVDLKVAGAGARSPGTTGSTSAVRQMPNTQYQAEMNRMKSRKGSVVDDNGSRVLFVETLAGGRKKFVELTKSSPLGCQVTVSFPAAKEQDARKIIESVKLLK